MTVKVGISLPDATHARALKHARSTGTTLSGLIDAALKAELTRRELAEHMAMLAEADDTERMYERARSRSRALAAWKTAAEPKTSPQATNARANGWSKCW